MKKLLVLLALSLLSIAAYAGYTRPAPVTIVYYELNELYIGSPAGGTAYGDMISARNSKNKDEFIGCGLRAYDDGAGGAYYSGFCQANLESDAKAILSDVTCFTENVALLEGINILADSSYITFDWEDDGLGNLTCTKIGTSTQSFYLEKGKAN